ncbi:REP element-mobilizing transposase RayT [Ectopseudomonas guguanensis]|uniref:REP element-mobilizing transposase RayT n=2 Tax=Ectopseudomonas guguanensis TaxID=1198456 RepID=A0A1H0W3H1_9GAMM|nr:REP element-mobilizing transposase RayT [Pseudomonas guguanensis]
MWEIYLEAKLLDVASILWDDCHSPRGAAPTGAASLGGLVQEPRLGAKLLDIAGWPLFAAGPAPYKRSVVLRFGVEGLLRGEAFFGSGSAKLNWRALTEGNPMTEKRYAAHKLRDGRWSSSGQIYLVTTVTNGRIPVFADFSAARTLIRVIRQDEQLGSHQTLCFVVMPDHLHWLLQLQSEDLARLVGRVKSISAKRLGRPIWQKGFHDHALRREEDVRSVARYVVANPLRAGLVQRVGDYPHWDAVWI